MNAPSLPSRPSVQEQATTRWRFDQDTARRYRTKDMEAACCLNFYASSPKDRETGNVWTRCTSCGQPLTYLDTPKPTMNKNQIDPSCVQELFDSARNAGDKGQAQYFTPPELGAVLARGLVPYRPVITDLHFGNAQLLAATANTTTAHLLGCEISRVRTVPLPADVTLHRVTGDVTRLYDFLAGVNWQGDVFVLNPPFDLHHPREPLLDLEGSDCDAVREAFPAWDGRTARDCVDSCVAALCLALDRCGDRGEGYVIMLRSTAERLMLVPGAPHGALAQHCWAVVDLARSFPVPCVALYFARDHYRGPQAATLEQWRTNAEGLRATWRSGIAPGPAFITADSADRWTAAQQGHAQATGQRQPEWNIGLKADGTLFTQLSIYDQANVTIPKEEAAELHRLNGQRPLHLVMQKATRKLLLKHAQGTLWRVAPAVLAAVTQALDDYDSERAPLWPLTPAMRLGWLEDAELVRCRVDLGPKSELHPDSLQRAREFVAAPTPETWRNLRDRCLWWMGPTFWQRVTALEPTFPTTTDPERDPQRLPKPETIERIIASPAPWFVAGQHYKLETPATWTVTRHAQVRSLDGRMEDVHRSGKELAFRLTDEQGVVRSFRMVRENEVEVRNERDAVLTEDEAPLTMQTLVEHFDIPEVPDIASRQPERYKQMQDRLQQLEELTEALT